MRSAICFFTLSIASASTKKPTSFRDTYSHKLKNKRRRRWRLCVNTDHFFTSLHQSITLVFCYLTRIFFLQRKQHTYTLDSCVDKSNQREKEIGRNREGHGPISVLEVADPNNQRERERTRGDWSPLAGKKLSKRTLKLIRKVSSLISFSVSLRDKHQRQHKIETHQQNGRI
ncbi:hypothetical protein L1887_28349 [Cichorium endivia]|nr:hypothetical protein L1887_28349 [Cichorium endivia]